MKNLSKLGDETLRVYFERKLKVNFSFESEVSTSDEYSRLTVSSQYKDCRLELYNSIDGKLNIPLNGGCHGALNVISIYVYLHAWEINIDDYTHFLIYSEEGVKIYRLTNINKSFIKTSQDWIEYGLYDFVPKRNWEDTVKVFFSKNRTV